MCGGPLLPGASCLETGGEVTRDGMTSHFEGGSVGPTESLVEDADVVRIRFLGVVPRAFSTLSTHLFAAASRSRWTMDKIAVENMPVRAHRKSSPRRANAVEQ